MAKDPTNVKPGAIVRCQSCGECLGVGSATKITLSHKGKTAGPIVIEPKDYVLHYCRDCAGEAWAEYSEAAADSEFWSVKIEGRVPLE